MQYLIIITSSLINPFFGLVFAVIDFISKDRKWKIDIAVFSFAVAHLSYYYYPESSKPDLYRYFEYFSSMKDMSFIHVLTNTYESSHLYIFNLFAWLGNALNDIHLVPFLSVFVVYYIGFYCACLYAEKEEISFKYVGFFVVISILCLDWYALTNNVRNILAFSLVGLAVFRDVYLEKKTLTTALLYIIPIFIHSTCIILIALRFVLFFVRSYKLKIPLLIITLLINPIVSILRNNISLLSFSSTLSYVVIKAYNYLFDTNSEYGLRVLNSTRSLLARILYLSLMVVLVVISIRISNHTKDINRYSLISISNNSIQIFEMMLCILALSCSFMLRPEYWRFASISISMSSILILPYYSLGFTRFLDVFIKRIYAILIILCSIISWYQVSYFDFPKLLVDSLTSVPLLTVFRYIGQLLSM